jgi:hypothetical protein
MLLARRRGTAVAYRSPVSNPDGAPRAWNWTEYGNTQELHPIARREPVRLVPEDACTRCD